METSYLYTFPVVAAMLAATMFTRLKTKLLGKPLRLKCLDKPTYFIRHCQTILASLKPCNKNTLSVFAHEGFSTTNASIDWVHINNNPINQDNSKKILLILPGLTGTRQSNYIIDTVKAMDAKGYKVGIYNYALTSNIKKKGRVQIMVDLEHTLIELRHRHQDYDRVDCVGFSYGANQLLYYLGTKGEASLVDKAVVIGNPFDLSLCSKYLGKFFDYLLARLLVNKVVSMWKYFQDYHLDYASIVSSKTVWDFDDRFTIHIYGFKSVDQYYKTLSSGQHVDGVRKPTLVISSEDDEVSTIRAITSFSSNVSYLVTNKGGHVGFLDWRFRFWFVEPMKEFLTDDKHNQ